MDEEILGIVGWCDELIVMEVFISLHPVMRQTREVLFAGGAIDASMTTGRLGRSLGADCPPIVCGETSN